MTHRASLAAPFAALLVLAACQDAPFTPPAEPTPAIPAAPPSEDVRTGWIYGPDGEPMEVTFAVFEGWAIFEGDINLGRADEIAKTRDELTRSDGPRYGVFINGSNYRWPNGVVPYVIASSFSAHQQQVILSALSHIAGNNGGITFKPRVNETAYLVFAPHTSVCNSFVGRQGNAQTVNLTAGCAQSMGIVVHEAMHALGIWHEQSRCDRDNYITVHLNNVLPNEAHNFDKKCSGSTSVFGYDEGSIMHYGTHAFSANGLPTITSKRGLDGMMGQRWAMSATDVNTVHYIYPPPVSVSVTNVNGHPVITPGAYPGATGYSLHFLWDERVEDERGSYSNNYRWHLGQVMPGGSYSHTSYSWTGVDSCYFNDGWRLEELTLRYELTVFSPVVPGGSRTTWVGAPVATC